MWKKDVFILFGLLLVVTNQDRDFLVLELQRGQVGEYYHVVMEIGTPPQRQSFDVDTGSPTLTLKCSDCGKDCQNSLYPNYEPSRSTTNVPILCNNPDFDCENRCEVPKDDKLCFYHLYYYSFLVLMKGHYMMDNAQFYTRIQQNDQSFPVSFGCANVMEGYQKNIDKKRSNGILGLGPSVKANVLYRWFDRNNYNISKVFTICLSSFGGYLQLGPSKFRRDEEKFQFSYTSQQSFYQLQQVELVKFGESSFRDFRDIRIAIDSGAPHFIVPEQMYKSFSRQLYRACQDHLTFCKPVDEKKVNAIYFIIDKANVLKTLDEQLDSIFPNLEVTVNGHTIITTPKEYFQQQPGGYAGFYGFLMVASKTPDLIILGMNWMKNKRISFLLDENRVQITPNQDCTFIEPSLIYTPKASTASIVVSYSILLGMLALVVGGSTIARNCSKLKNRFGKKEIEFVEEVEHNSEHSSNN